MGYYTHVNFHERTQRFWIKIYNDKEHLIISHSLSPDEAYSMILQLGGRGLTKAEHITDEYKHSDDTGTLIVRSYPDSVIIQRGRKVFESDGVGMEEVDEIFSEEIDKTEEFLSYIYGLLVDEREDGDGEVYSSIARNMLWRIKDSDPEDPDVREDYAEEDNFFLSARPGYIKLILELMEEYKNIFPNVEERFERVFEEFVLRDKYISPMFIDYIVNYRKK